MPPKKKVRHSRRVKEEEEEEAEEVEEEEEEIEVVKIGKTEEAIEAKEDLTVVVEVDTAMMFSTTRTSETMSLRGNIKVMDQSLLQLKKMATLTRNAPNSKICSKV